MKGSSSKSGAKKTDSKLSVEKPKMPKGHPFPKSARFIFKNESGFRKQFRKKNPGNKSPTVVHNAAMAEWEAMSDADKAPYLAEYEKRLAEYMQKMEKFKESMVEYGESITEYNKMKQAAGEQVSYLPDEVASYFLAAKEEIERIGIEGEESSHDRTK